MFQWNCHAFYDNSKAIWEMITEVYVLVHHGYMIKLVDNTENQIIDDTNMPKI